jgi:diaminopimelate epimerase
MEFTKWNGCGNDFVFVNAMNRPIEPVTAECTKICDRHFGVGADGIIFILPSEQADFRMRIFNCDGSEAEMCGNGIRCFARLVRELGLTGKKRFTVETGAGIMIPEVLDDGQVCVDMGAPRLAAGQIPVTGFGEGSVVRKICRAEGDPENREITCVSMGNPHCVIFVPRVDDVELDKIGPFWETHPNFPAKTNTEFVEKIDESTLRMRVWERGAGITMACGTGACATLTAAVLCGLIEREADVVLDGGTVHIRWDGGSSHVFMTGPAEKVFEGTYRLSGEDE